MFREPGSAPSPVAVQALGHMIEGLQSCPFLETCHGCGGRCRSSLQRPGPASLRLHPLLTLPPEHLLCTQAHCRRRAWVMGTKRRSPAMPWMTVPRAQNQCPAAHQVSRMTWFPAAALSTLP